MSSVGAYLDSLNNTTAGMWARLANGGLSFRGAQEAGVRIDKGIIIMGHLQNPNIPDWGAPNLCSILILISLWETIKGH